MQLHPAHIQFQYVIAPYRRAIGLWMSLRAQMCGEGKRFEVSGLISTSNPIPCVISLSNILQGPWQHLEGSWYTSELLLTCHWLTGILGLPWWATLDTLVSKISPWTLWPKGRRLGKYVTQPSSCTPHSGYQGPWSATCGRLHWNLRLCM